MRDGEAPREIRIELPHPMQIDAYRRMTPAQRLAAGAQMTVLARSLLRGYFSDRHEDWSESQIREAIARRMLGNAA